nr:hypothetical protein [Tanacetum cinerariifolium]
MKDEESLNVTYDESPSPSRPSPLVDDNLVEEEAIEVSGKKHLGDDIEKETLEIDEIVNIKESKNHPLNNVKENQKKDKIGSKSDKNGKRGEARKSQKQLQSIEKEKLKKMQVEWPDMQNHTKLFKKEEKKD